MRMVPARRRVAPLLLLALLSASIIPASETLACAARMHRGDETNIKQPTHYTQDILQTRGEARWQGVPALPIRRKTPLRLRGGNEGEYELQGGFFFGDEVRNGATGPPHSPWTTHSHLEMRAKPDGTVKSDNELRAEEHPGGYHPWYGSMDDPPTLLKDRSGFCTTNLHVLNNLYGRSYLDSDYVEYDAWIGGRSSAAERCGFEQRSDAHLLDDHYETSLRDEPIHEYITWRKSARVGQWLDFGGTVMLDHDGSLTNINGGSISNEMRCFNSKNQVYDPRETVSALAGMEIPLGLSLNAVARELNEDPYTLAVRELTGAEPDLMVCDREEEMLELRLQAACEGIVEDQEGLFCWDIPQTVQTKVHSLVKAGVDFNWADDWGWTPLHCAVSNGNTAAMEALFKYLPELDLEIPSKPRGWTALFRAVYRGYDHVLELLLKAGANPWHVDSENMTAFEVAIRYNSTNCVPLLRNYMGPEVDDLDLEGLVEEEPMPDFLRTPAGAGVPRYLAEGWPIKKADISMTHKDRYVANVSKIFKWTEADAEQQRFIHEKLIEHRNKTGIQFYPDPDGNPLNLRIPWPDHDKVFPMEGLASGDPSKFINYTALKEAQIIESESREDSDMEEFLNALKVTKGNTTAQANLFHYTGKVPPANQTTRAEVYYGKRVLDPLDMEDFQKILYMNFGPEPGAENRATMVNCYPEGRHNQETVYYSNQPGLVINLVRIACIGRDPRPPLMLDRVCHTRDHREWNCKKGVPVPQGRGTIVDVLGSRGARCVVKWDMSLPNAEFGGTTTTCAVGYRRRFTLELAVAGQSKWEEDVLRKMEDLAWEGKLAPNPEVVSKEDYIQMQQMEEDAIEEANWKIRHNATLVMRPDGSNLISPRDDWNVPTYTPPDALPEYQNSCLMDE